MSTKLSHLARPISIILIFAFAFTLSLSPQSSASAGTREPVAGTMTVSFYTAGCNSPIGQCGQGPVTGNLKGNFNGILDTFTVVFQNGQPFQFVFTGTATISAVDGDLFGNLTITEPAAIGGFLSATMQFTGGTKRFKHADGMINIQQTQPDNGVSFLVTYQGSLFS